MSCCGHIQLATPWAPISSRMPKKVQAPLFWEVSAWKENRPSLSHRGRLVGALPALSTAAFDFLLTGTPGQDGKFVQGLLPINDRGVANTVLYGLQKLTREDKGTGKYS